MKRIGRIGRIGAIKALDVWEPEPARGVELAKGGPGGPKLLALDPPELVAWVRVIGRERARRAWRLVERGVLGTLPELCAYDWLERRQIPFEFQSEQMGGRRLAGGMIVDFLVAIRPDVWTCWRIQSEYWHTGAAVEEKDAGQKARLLRAQIEGRGVWAVVDLWETDIYRRWPAVFELAEAGEGLRG